MNLEEKQKIDDIKQRCDRNTVYISDTERHISEIRNEMTEVKIENIRQHKEIMDILRPIADTYNGVSFFGKWGMKFLVLLSVASGLIWGWFAFLKPMINKFLDK